MTRIIMLAIIGMLITFLVLNLLTITGLEMLAKRLEHNLEVKHLNKDMEFVNTFLSENDSTAVACRTQSGDLQIMKSYHLTKKTAKSEIDAARMDLIRVSRQAANCFQESTNECVAQQSEGCTKKSLYVYAGCLDIAGRHLKVEFDTIEKEMYRKIFAMENQHPAPGREEILQLADMALSTFRYTLQKVNGHWDAVTLK